MIDGLYPVIGSTSTIGFHNECKVDPPGVITGRSGSLGIVQFINKKYWPHNTALWVKDFKGRFPRYVYYYLQTLDLKRFNSGVGVPTLNRNDLDNLRINIHPFIAQRKIAAVLSAYDDLIENNTKRIKILEEMAQAIYREWFVEFRAPGVKLRKATEEEKEVTGKDQIPEGWEIYRYSDLLESYTGGDWGEEDPNEKHSESVIVIRGTDFASVQYGGKVAAPLRYITESSLIKRKLKEGDLIIENSVNAQSRCVGKNILISSQILRRLQNDAIAASFCKVFRPLNIFLSPLISLHMKELHESGSMAFYQHVATNGIGNFQATRFVEREAFVAPQEGTDLFNNLLGILNSIAKYSAILASTISNLSATSALMLPKLISGELDVSELDIQIKETA
jgi:type I restriction enzyme S subunit